ncbi:hypothetical protein SAMN05216524_103139 [Mucilaginibacter sp. OK098]|nr:hypothetical protein SAMN05216524_103139 [Mucilaginibacter sp. OK098]
MFSENSFLEISIPLEIMSIYVILNLCKFVINHQESQLKKGDQGL